MNSTAPTERPSFKKSTVVGDARRSRLETTVLIRKNRKEEQMQKRRMAGPKSSSGTTGPQAIADAPTGTNCITVIAENMQVLHKWKADPPSTPIEEVEEAVKQIRRLLSAERNPPVEQVIRAGAMPYLVAFLSNDTYPTLQFEAAWAITNVASTNHTAFVANEDNAISQLVRLLTSTSPQVREQVVWAVGNIAGDNVLFRDGLLKSPGLVAGIIDILRDPGCTSMAQTVAWTVSNLCRGKPVADLSIVGVFIEPIVTLLLLMADPGTSTPETEEARVDLIWCLSYMSDGDNSSIQAVQTTSLPILTHIIENCLDSRKLLVPTVRCIGNFATGSDEQTDAVLDSGFLMHARRLLLECPSKNIKKDTVWTLSNVAAGNESQITKLFEPAGLVVELVQIAIDAPWEVRKEAIWTICNILTCGNDRHMVYLVQADCIQALCDALKIGTDVGLLLAVMDAFEKLLDSDEKYERNYRRLMDESGGIDNLEEVQNHPNDDVYEKASNLVKLHFSDEEAEDQNLAPAVTAEDGTFAFGFPSKQLFPGFAASPPVNFNFGGSTTYTNIADV